MRKVNLRMNEQFKYDVIKNLVDNNGNKLRAALKLNCTLRNVNKLISKYLAAGKQGFIHGNRGKLPVTSKTIALKQQIALLYENKYFDCNWRHFLELLAERENIKVSYNFLYQTLFKYGFISPKCFRATKRKKALELKLKSKLTSYEQDLVVCNNILDPLSAHPRLPRSKYLGESLQMDASFHLWFGDKKAYLHAAIDDASGIITGAYFDHQETLNGYYNVLFQVLTDFGIPNEFLTDNRTIFNYERSKKPNVEKDTFTQFGYACNCLGISLKTTSIPQAKGRIERLFNTLQSRLTVELRLAGIASIEEANIFLKHYLKKHNLLFSLPLKNITSVFESKPAINDIYNYLAIITTRKFDNGSAIKLNHKYYQAYDEKIINFTKGTKCLVIQTFDQRTICSVNDHLYELRELPVHALTSKNFDEPQEQKIRTIYIPPMSHPWKAKSFENYLSKQKHTINNAYV